MASAYDGGAADLARAMTTKSPSPGRDYSSSPRRDYSSSPRRDQSSSPSPRRDQSSSPCRESPSVVVDAIDDRLGTSDALLGVGRPPSSSSSRSRQSSTSSKAASSNQIRRKSEFVSVRGTPTHLIKYGHFCHNDDDDERNDDDRNDDDDDDSGGLRRSATLVLVIPGNPGVPDYYDHFMETLHLASGGSLPVWCVSHAGHVLTAPPSASTSAPDASAPGAARASATEAGAYPRLRFDQNDPHRSLRGQVAHKLAFIQDYFLSPRKTTTTTTTTTTTSKTKTKPVSGLKLILVGHSIGCWMICELIKKLKPELKESVVKAYLLFPTIERMAVSPNGRFLTPLVTYIPAWILAAPLHFFQLLPQSWQKAFLRYYFSGRGLVPDCVYRATLVLAQPRSVANTLELYYEESYTVVDLDADFIQAHVSKLVFYYGTTDAWVPTRYYHEMKETFPEADVRLCQEGYEHAFVVKSSQEMGLQLWSWILDEVLEEDERKWRRRNRKM